MSDDRDSEPVSLAEKRMERLGDCRQWSPADALRAALRDIEQGRIAPTQLAIHYLEPREGERWQAGYLVAGVTSRDHIALLEIAKDQALRYWWGEE